MRSAEEELDHASPSCTVQSPLKVIIPYTSPDLTRAALRAAAEIAGDLCAEPVLMAVHIVPYPLSLDRPDVPREHLQENLEKLTSSSTVPLSIHLVLARDRMSAFRETLLPASIVIIAAKRRWWWTAEDRLARALKKEGHRVVLFKLRRKRWTLSSNELPASLTIADSVTGCELANSQIPGWRSPSIMKSVNT